MDVSKGFPDVCDNVDMFEVPVYLNYSTCSPRESRFIRCVALFTVIKSASKVASSRSKVYHFQRLTRLLKANSQEICR